MALYKDQAGKYDWLKQNIGDIILADLDHGIHVASKQGVIASLNDHDGSIKWRAVLDENEEILSISTTKEITLVLTSDAHVYAFGTSGQQIWDLFIPSEWSCTRGRPAIAAVLSQSTTIKSQALIACNNILQSRDLFSGRKLWHVSLPGGDKDSTVAILAPTQGSDATSIATIAVLDTTSSILHKATLLLSSGTITSEQDSSPSSTPLDPISLTMVTPSSVAALSSDGLKLCTASFSENGSATSVRCHSISQLLNSNTAPTQSTLYGGGGGGGSSSSSTSSSSDTCGAHVTLQTDIGAAVVHINDSGNAKATYTDATTATPTTVSPCSSSTALFAMMHSSGLQVTIVDVTTGKESHKQTYESLRRTTIDGTLRRVSSVFTGKRESSGSGSELCLIQSDDGALSLLDFRKERGNMPPSKSIIWTREESLATVVDVMFEDLPHPTAENEAEWLSHQPSMMESLSAQLAALKEQINVASPEEKELVEKYRKMTSDRLRPTRDPGGFRRQIMVVTEVGKVLSLHSGDGRVLWTLDFGNSEKPVKLAPWRTPHNMKDDAFIVIFATNSKKTGAARRDHTVGAVTLTASVVNSHTGEITKKETVDVKDGRDVEVLPLPDRLKDGNIDQHVFVVVTVPPSSNGQETAAVTVLPDSPDARAIFAQHAEHIVHWRISDDGAAVHGIGFSSEGKESVLWTYSAAPEDSKLSIVATAARPSQEAVYSAARPMFGGDIMLKYLNPNMLLVVSGTTDHQDNSKGTAAAAAGGGSRKAKGGGVLIVTLLDTTTGTILFSQIHHHTGGPVHAIVSENWAAYHFWSSVEERWQISVIDLYRPVPASLSVLDLALRNATTLPSEVATSSGGTEGTGGGAIIVERRTYQTKLAATSLSVTQTAHGTAAKMLLIGTPGGQVYMLDRRMVDPRRPVVPSGTKPTPAQMAEGLPPYAIELGIAGPSFATLDQRVARLRTITTAPAVLESATLLFSSGLDLFFSRVQPSRGFDMVPDDFPHALLVAMVLAMAVALFLLRAVLQQRALKLKWQ